MIRRTTRITLEIVAVILAGLAVAIGLMAWRLSTGPLSIDFLTPYIEKALDVRDGDMTVRVDDTVLTWGGWGRPFEVRAVGLRVAQDDGTARIVIPELTIQFGFRALLNGVVAPISLEVRRPNLRLVRTAEGRLAFGLERDLAKSGPLFPQLIAALFAEPQGGAQNYLSTIRIVEARLTIEDRFAGRSWLAPRADIAFERDVLGLRASVALDIAVNENVAHFDTVAVYDRAAGSIRIGARFTGLDPSVLTPDGAELATAKVLRVPLEGTLTAVADTGGRVSEASFDIRGGKGSLDVAALLGRNLPIENLRAKGRMLDNLTRLVIDRMEIDLGGPTALVSGDISGLGEDTEMRLGVVVRDVPGNDVMQYWPAQWAANARRWLKANISDGDLDEVSADLRLRGKLSEGGTLEVISVAGAGRFRGATIAYLPAQPPVRGADGNFTFNTEGMDIRLTAGRLDGMTLESAKVLMTGFEQSEQHAAITGRMRGPLRAVLKLAEREPYHYVQALGLNVGDVVGEIDARFELRLPLIDALTLDQVAVKAQASLRSVAWRDALFGVDLDQGELELELDQSGMHVQGTASLAGAPAKVEWRENFGRKAPFRRRMKLSGQFGSGDRAKLGLDVAGYVEGPVAADLTMTTWRSGKSRVEAVIELTDSWLDVPVLGWQKAPRLPGRAKVTLELDGERVTDVSSFSIETADLRARGRASLAGEPGQMTELEVDLNIGDMTDARLTAKRREDGSYLIEVAGDRFDVSRLLDKPAPAEATQYPPFTLEARLKALHFAPDRFIGAVSLVGQHDGNDWRAVVLRGTVGDGKAIDVNYGRAGGASKLLIRSDDAGAVFRAIDIADAIVGGKLKVTGASDPEKPDQPFSGEVEVTDFRMAEAPVLARMFALASFRGFGDLLSGEDGISFSRYEGTYSFHGDVLSIAKSRAYGSEVGITMKGVIDLEKDEVALQGTLVPAYTLNSVLGNIPVLGTLLVGEEGSGVFAATYAATGPTDDPRISVNPLAVLTPGFLRVIFSAFSGGEEVPDNIEEFDFAN